MRATAERRAGDRPPPFVARCTAVVDLQDARVQSRAAAEGEVFVQFWLKPGGPPLELAIEEPGEVEGVPEVLRGYL